MPSVPDRRALRRRATVAALFGFAAALTVSEASAQVAFPGAEGFGALATGGRGGRVIKVTNLDASGPGSLQWALDQPGPRIVVFDVSGVIEGDILVPHGDVTIAGESAPGGGITIAGRLTAEYDESVQNIVVRFLRVRPPPLTGGSDGEQYDAVQFSRNRRFILDHISVSWASDETIDLYEAVDATVQWSTIEESSVEGHPEGEHNYGLINGPDGSRVSIHHNLFAHHKNRCPALATGPADVRNNVVYDAQHGFVHHNEAWGAFNIVGNYYRQGPSAALFPFYFDGGEGSSYFLADNYIDDPDDFTGLVDDPWTSGEHPTFGDMEGYGQGVSEPFDFSGEPSWVPVTTDDVFTAYDRVLSLAGAFPRDMVTWRTLAEVEDRTGSWGAKPPADLFEGLNADAPAADSDSDGMPDAWESANGLDPDDGADASEVTGSGYTAIETYLHERAAALTGDAPSNPVGGGSGGGSSGTGGPTPVDDGYEYQPQEGSGCACATESRGESSSWAWAVVVGLWLTIRRRRLTRGS